MKIALLVSNRGFFPSAVIEAAQEEMNTAMACAGLECLALDRNATKYGAVETTADGIKYAAFLKEHHGEYDGIIVCLPNFGDENGIKAALADCDVPVLLQAYPDEIGKMDFTHRRDAFCGKLGLTSVLKQMGLQYTSFLPFVVHPSSQEFHEQLQKFAAVCRVYKRMRRIRIGVIGARTTAFKSVRCDEMALERRGIDVETLDLSMLFMRMRDYKGNEPQVTDWMAQLEQSADFSCVPEGKLLTLARLGAALSAIIADMKLDATAIRCWSELQTELGIAPCAVMGLLNHGGIPTVCETDVSNAVAMAALAAASGCSSGCLDWNNNYGNNPDKCILFHCGPLPLELMRSRGVLEEHRMLSKTFGEGCSWGLNVGKIRAGNITFAGMRTEAGRLEFYIDQGIITEDPVESEFFGTSGVLQVQGLQRKLMRLSEAGFRHHVTITTGDVCEAVCEALTKYLGYTEIPLHA